MKSCIPCLLEHLQLLPNQPSWSWLSTIPWVGLGGLGWRILAHFFPCPWVQQGPVTLEESVRGVLQLLAQLSATSNGTFWDWRGQRLPW